MRMKPGRDWMSKWDWFEDDVVEEKTTEERLPEWSYKVPGRYDLILYFIITCVIIFTGILCCVCVCV